MSWLCLLIAVVIPMLNTEMRTGIGLVLAASCFVVAVLLAYTGFHTSVFAMRDGNILTKASGYFGVGLNVTFAIGLLLMVVVTIYWTPN